MLGLRSPFSKALSKGIGKSLKVATVACGRHNDGLARSLKTFRDAERLRFISLAQVYPHPRDFVDEVDRSGKVREVKIAKSCGGNQRGFSQLLNPNGESTSSLISPLFLGQIERLAELEILKLEARQDLSFYFPSIDNNTFFILLLAGTASKWLPSTSRSPCSGPDQWGSL